MIRPQTRSSATTATSTAAACSFRHWREVHSAPLALAKNTGVSAWNEQGRRLACVPLPRHAASRRPVATTDISLHWRQTPRSAKCVPAGSVSRFPAHPALQRDHRFCRRCSRLYNHNRWRVTAGCRQGPRAHGGTAILPRPKSANPAALPAMRRSNGWLKTASDRTGTAGRVRNL